jgi:hypothetical protein
MEAAVVRVMEIVGNNVTFHRSVGCFHRLRAGNGNGNA